MKQTIDSLQTFTDGSQTWVEVSTDVAKAPTLYRRIDVSSWKDEVPETLAGISDTLSKILFSPLKDHEAIPLRAYVSGKRSTTPLGLACSCQKFESSSGVSPTQMAQEWVSHLHKQERKNKISKYPSRYI